jgi:hypothetical protein
MKSLSWKPPHANRFMKLSHPHEKLVMKARYENHGLFMNRASTLMSHESYAYSGVRSQSIMVHERPTYMQRALFIKDMHTQEPITGILRSHSMLFMKLCIFRKQVLHQNALFNYPKCTPKLAKSHKKP